MPLPHEINLIVECHTTLARRLPRVLDRKIIEVIEDGVKRPPKSEDFDMAIRWLMTHHYVPVKAGWVVGYTRGILRRKRYDYRRGTKEEAQAVGQDCLSPR